MHNNMEGGEGEKINENRIFIQHEKDKLNFTWENFSSSEFVGKNVSHSWPFKSLHKSTLAIITVSLLWTPWGAWACAFGEKLRRCRMCESALTFNIFDVFFLIFTIFRFLSYNPWNCGIIETNYHWWSNPPKYFSLNTVLYLFSAWQHVTFVREK